MSAHLDRAVIRQIKRLEPNAQYAIVFNRDLSADEMKVLTEVCQQMHISALALSGATVTRLDEAAVVARVPSLEAGSE